MLGPGRRSLVNDWLKKVKAEVVEPPPRLLSGVRPFPRGWQKFYKVFGDSDKNFSIDNYTIEGFEVEDGFLLDGRGRITRRKTYVWPKLTGFTSWRQQLASQRIHSVTGELRAGALWGCCTILLCNGVQLVAQHTAGTPHGLAMATFNEEIIWVGWLNPRGKEDLQAGEEDIESGEYIDGVNEGPGESCSRCWESGALLINPSKSGPGQEQKSGTYIYPDLHTALVGDFTNGEMNGAQKAEVVQLSIQDDILHVETSKPSGRWFALAPSTKTSFGSSDPLLPDPFEERVVEVRGSQMEGGGQGVFTRVPLFKGAVALIFNGYKVPLAESNIDWEKETEETLYDRLAYNIHMPQEEDFFLDFPPSQADLTVYCASLGHKVNHSFVPNAEFSTIYHPRWGRVRSVVTLRDVAVGEELLVDYGYDLIRCPSWFRQLWEQQLGHKYKHWMDFKR